LQNTFANENYEPKKSFASLQTPIYAFAICKREFNKMTSPLNISVSCFKNAKDTTPKEVNLLALLNSVEHKEQVIKVRATPEKNVRDELKKQIAAFTPSGIFSRRAILGLIKHSGLMAFDIDFAVNQHILNFTALKEQISNITNVAYCGLSVSGNGFWGLIPIQYPEKHKAHFAALERAFAKYGITIDPSCKDVTRLRFCSYDPDAYFNHNAITFKGLYEPAPSQTIKYSSTKTPNAKPLEVAIKIIRNAPDGQKWECLNRAAYLLGGYVASGTVSESEARQTLQNAISAKANVSNLEAAFKTIDFGLRDGQKKPIYPPIKTEPLMPLNNNTDFLKRSPTNIAAFQRANDRKNSLENYVKKNTVTTSGQPDFIRFCEAMDNEYKFKTNINV
jgi:hypothetical protein